MTLHQPHRRMTMPYAGLPERDPHKWQRCLDAVKANMLAAGWNKHAGKFWTVQHRRAARLYAVG